MKCPQCGNEVEEGALFCDQCGTKVEASAPGSTPAPAAAGICPSCGASNVPGEAFCESCGAPLETPAPAEAPPTPAPAPPTTPETEGTCPACGATLKPGDTFCSNCGAALTAAPPPPEPVAETPPPPPVAAPPTAEVPAITTCPACGGDVTADDTFCSHCGASLAQPAEAPPPPAAIEQPCLVVADSGARIALPQTTEILIGREDPVSGVYPDVDLTPHGGEEGGVSRQHAKLIVEGEEYFVQDLKSTNFTFVNRQKLTPGVRHPLNDGDEIRCGRVKFTFHTG